jgi:uncharacterized membrane-anchored protein YhcB (DUF1043 family)
MSEKNGTKILLAFVAGAAIGAAIGYFLKSDDKEEILTDIQEGATKLKKDIEENLARAKEMVDNFRNSNVDPSTENPE